MKIPETYEEFFKLSDEQLKLLGQIEMSQEDETRLFAYEKQKIFESLHTITEDTKKIDFQNITFIELQQLINEEMK